MIESDILEMAGNHQVQPEGAQLAISDTSRVIYERNTLEEVKCEIRFPPILTIDISVPINFQELIRDKFPYFELKSSVKVPSGIPQIVAQAVERDISLVGRSYLFTSEDRNFILALSKESLSLTCRKYDRWESFRELIDSSLTSFATIYRPNFFNHTCVRFKNSIRRTPLGLSETPWAELLNPWISGPLQIEETAGEVKAFQSRCLLQLPGNAEFIDANTALGIHQSTSEISFIIQSHVYNDDRKVLADVLSRLDSLNMEAGNFFRRCITDRLHWAMQPKPI